MRLPLLFLAGAMALASASSGAGSRPGYRAQLIFPLDYQHNHGSCVAEDRDGGLVAVWYRGSGERRADDVALFGSRLQRGGTEWSPEFSAADTPGFPDCNPCDIVDPQGRLRMYWPVVIANEWHTSLLMEKVSEPLSRSGPPKWRSEKPVFLKPGSEFPEAVERWVQATSPTLTALPADQQATARRYLETVRKNASDKYFNRMGWMPRAHPLILDGNRLIVPLYSDGFSFSLMAITDDWGDHWHVSGPLVGAGPVQPALARRKDGTLVAFMRDNGPPPKRIPVSESRDRGETWSEVKDTDLPNPGSGLDVAALRSGRWALVYNDTERGRHSLAISLSDDEGRTWKRTRHLEQDLRPQNPTTAAYPSILQGRDGRIHVTYTYTVSDADAKLDAQGRRLRECIKHAEFDEAWVLAGDASQMANP
jgi:hypothetical protein